MLLTKLKIIVLLLVVIGVAGTGWGNYRTWANDQPAMQGGQQVAQAEVQQPKTVQPEQDKTKKSDGKKAPDEKRPPDQDQANAEAFLKAFQIASEIAKAKGKKAPDEKRPSDQDQAKQVLELMRKGLEAYQASKGKEGAGANMEARRTELETLEEIKRVVQQMKKKLQESKDGK